MSDETPEVPEFQPTVRGIAEAIKQMELDLGLLEDDTFGREARLAWEAFRVSFYDRLKKRFVGHSEAHTFAKRRHALARWIRVAPSVLWASLLKNPFLMPRGRPFLFFSHVGGVKDENGLHWNRTTDPVILSLASTSIVNVEMARAYSHLTPTPTRKHAYSDFTDILVGIWARLWREPTRSLRSLAREVEGYARARLGVSEPIASELVRTYRRMSATRSVYRGLIRFLKPEVIFLVCSYGKEGIVLAGKDTRVPVVEFQHGVITNEHLGYAVPMGRPKLSSPDYLLTFGTHWQETVDHSQDRDHLIPIGFPFLEREWFKYKRSEKDIDILFVSQGTIGHGLAQFAASFVARLDGRLRVVYKLHRGEMFQWRNRYPRLSRSEADGVIKVIDSADAGSFYGFLGRAKVVVGVYSTGLFESLKFGCRLFLVDLPGIEYMDPVIRTGLAQVVHDSGDLLSHTADGPGSDVSAALVDQLYAEDWGRRFRGFLDYVHTEIESARNRDRQMGRDR